MEKVSNGAVAPMDKPARSYGLHGFTRVCVILVERVMPDPFVIAIFLTLLTCVLAVGIAPHGSIGNVVASWYEGVFKIASFAFLVALTLVTGHALSTSKPVSLLLRKVASIPRTAGGAMALTFFVSMIGGLLNWAVGLVISALFAREIAKRVRVDFAWLVAAAYAGWSFYVCGISSSIALLSATHGSPLNIIEKVTGNVLQMKDFLFSPLNFVPLVVLAVVIPLVFRMMMPRDNETIAADPKRLIEEDVVEVSEKQPTTLAAWLDSAWALNLILVVLGLGYIVMKLAVGSFTMDLNMLVMIFLLLGLVTHWTPRAYLSAINNAARVAGPILLQFPIYGGIMGVMTATGLADVIAKWFIGFSTTHTLPFWSFVSSTLISMFVPSAGGHWIVQAPFVVPAAQHLGVPQHAVAISVALGEGVADMIQPMWVIPLLAIAGVGMGRVMGYTVIIFFIMFAVMGGTLLLL
ncbi:short-chain fatty acid transporter [Paraburkholderia sp. J63]|uniref:short-chain fatty acid transporter n=1 Tax=Paraburkholderia sp. J63 TaxID=2805434 RepID=UPI002ABDA76E|nr:TIGR00366 family protein [Paraburkholderia sp. J63]